MLKMTRIARLACVAVLTLPALAIATPIMFGVNDDTDQLWSFDLDAGTGFSVGRIEANGRRVDEIESLTFDPGTGLLYGVQDLCEASSVLYAIDPDTAKARRIGPVGYGSIESLSFNPIDGLLYAVGNDKKKASLLTLDLASGAGRLVSEYSLRTSEDIQGLAWNLTGTHLLASVVKNSGSSLVELDPVRGTTRQVGDLGYRKVEALEYGPDGVLYGASDTSNTLLTVNDLTGGSRKLPVDVSVSDVEGIAFRVPEPTSMALLLSGAVLAVLRLRRSEP
jgi:uncharacterized protein YjiK